MPGELEAQVGRWCGRNGATRSESNRDEARDVMGVRHGAGEHEGGRSWKAMGLRLGRVQLA